MHIADFYLYNSYIPQEFRKIIRDFYGSDSGFFSKQTASFKEVKDEQLNDNTFSTRYDLNFKYLVNDDIQIGIQNQFGKVTNLPGMEGLGQIPSLLKLAPSLINKQGNDNSIARIQNLSNLFNYSVWEKTEPLTVNINIVLYAKTDPLIDVVVPAYAIMSHCIIDFAKEQSRSPIGVSNPKETTLYGFPGLSAFEVTKIDKAIEKILDPKYNEYKNAGSSFYSKLVSLKIDGLVNLDLAMIKNISPVFSKHTAKSSYKSEKNNTGTNVGIQNEFSGDYPIYAEISLQIESLTPADSNMLWGGVLNSSLPSSGLSYSDSSIPYDTNSSRTA